MQNLTYKELFGEGERLCKLGDCQNGIKFFEEALQQFAATNNSTSADLKLESVTDLTSLNMLSIIYNQMGNAYFYLRDYTRALDCYTKDLELCERLDDAVGKAKACCNIGNTLSMVGDYDEAILYSLRNLELCNQLNDTTGEARASYNLGNIYQSKGKHMCSITHGAAQNEMPAEIRETLTNAIHYYKQCLFIVASIKDRSAEGRTYGQLGNTYYLLGEFDSAIECHQERLKIAKEFGDKAAERRAYNNLGNAYTFMGRYNEAADHYMKAMNVARLMDDKAIEAQAYFGLGNVYTLLQDYSIAVDFHQRHLQLAVMLKDIVGETRAYWSLGNIYASMGELESAVECAQKHLNLARQIGDDTSELTAKMNLYEFQKLLSNNRDNESHLFTPISKFYGQPSFERLSVVMRKSNSIESIYAKNDVSKSMHRDRLRANNLTTALNSAGNNTSRALSATNINQTGLSTSTAAYSHPPQPVRPASQAPTAATLFKDNQMKMIDEDDDFSFLDTLSKIQSDRLDDQRCSIKLKPLSVPSTTNSSPQTNKPSKVSSSSTLKENSTVKKIENNKLNQDEFFNMLMKCQGSRLEDQRSSLALLKTNNQQHQPVNNTGAKPNAKKSSLNEAFFSMLNKVQSRRIDEQRSGGGIKTLENKLKS